MSHSHAKQNWEVGASVKVGFLSLIIVGQEGTPGDYKPNAWLLMNAKGDKHYRFVPHFGLEAIR